MGLKHHKLIKKENNPGENLKLVLESICPNMTAAENDFVALHLLEFNGRIKSSVTKDGFTYNINDVYICQRLEQQFNGNVFKFRSNKPFEQFGPVDDLLSTCFISMNDSTECPNFMDMPAFVTKWADDITSTIAIKGPFGPIKGLSLLTELFK